MTTLKITIDQERLQRTLQRLVLEMPEVADQIVRKVAFDIVSDVAERVPVDTGRLRAGWRASLETLSGTGDSDTVKAIEQDDYLQITVTNPVKYAPYIEYGTAYIPPGLQLSTAIESVRRKLVAEMTEAAELGMFEIWDSSR